MATEVFGPIDYARIKRALRERKLHQFTNTPLGADGIYRSTPKECLLFSRVVGVAFADVASATDGLEIRQNADGEVDAAGDLTRAYVTTYTVSANTPLAFSIELVGRFVQVKYINGGVAQTVFRLGTWLRPLP